MIEVCPTCWEEKKGPYPGGVGRLIKSGHYTWIEVLRYGPVFMFALGMMNLDKGVYKYDSYSRTFRQLKKFPKLKETK